MATVTKAIKKPKTSPAKCRTPFNELRAAPSSYPFRKRCQEVVLDIERAEGIKLIADFRAAEEHAAANDIASNSPNPLNAFVSKDPVAAEERRRKIAKMDHQQFLVAASQMSELREDACNLAKTIFGRLIESFDDELNQVASEAEACLGALGVPICNQGDWELWHSVECSWRHSWREVCKRQAKMMAHEHAAGAVQYFCSDEERVPFQWL